MKILLALLLTPLLASPGDLDPIFIKCVSLCQANACTESTQLPLHLKLTMWTCESNCNYQCMRKITDEKRRLGEDVDQFFGKWPFIRVLGMQEVFSVVFSILNFVSHVRGFSKYRRLVKPDYFMKPIIAVSFALNLNAWIWSAVFHARDTAVTEKLDYFSATLLLLFACYYSLVRIFRIEFFLHQILLLLPFIAFFFYHIGYLLFVIFDYGYNMKVGVAVGISFNLLWVAWYFFNRKRSYASKSVAFVFMITCCSLLEVFDFAPIGMLLDAHALWHLGTAMIIPLWYDFMTADALFEIEQKINEQKIY